MIIDEIPIIEVDEKPEEVIKTVCALPDFGDWEDEVVEEIVEEVVEHIVETTEKIVTNVEEIVANIPTLDIETKPEEIIKTVCELPNFDDEEDEVVEEIVKEVVEKVEDAAIKVEVLAEEILAEVDIVDFETKPEEVIKTICELPDFDDFPEPVVKQIVEKDVSETAEVIEVV